MSGVKGEKAFFQLTSKILTEEKTEEDQEKYKKVAKEAKNKGIITEREQEIIDILIGI